MAIVGSPSAGSLFRRLVELEEAVLLGLEVRIVAHFQVLRR
jgi:hypothetical protein